MALRDNTIGLALDAIETVIGGALMSSELDYFNAELGFRLELPADVKRGAVATFSRTKLPAVLLYAQTDVPLIRTSGPRDYHRFRVVIALGIGVTDVKAGGNTDDLHRGIVTYLECMRRALIHDVSTTDPGSTLRNAGVITVADFTTNFEPLEPGTTTNANHVTAVATATLTQLRPGRTT